jgi:hypothetical protein
VSLPPTPLRVKPYAPTPEEIKADALRYEALFDELTAKREAWEKRKAAMTPEAKAAKAARDYVHWLRRQLRRAADAARWERLTVALEAHAWEREDAKRKADEVRERVRNRTADTYRRAAAGCLTCAAFIADESADELYREVFSEPTG